MKSCGSAKKLLLTEQMLRQLSEHMNSTYYTIETGMSQQASGVWVGLG